RRAVFGQAVAVARADDPADRRCRAAGIFELGDARRCHARTEARARDYRLCRELHLQLGQVLRRLAAVTVSTVVPGRPLMGQTPEPMNSIFAEFAPTSANLHLPVFMDPGFTAWRRPGMTLGLL